MKTCTKCGTEKPLTEFNNNSTRPDGKHTQCKACRSAYRTSAHGRAVKRVSDAAYLQDPANRPVIQAHRRRTKRAYYKRYPEVRRAENAARRARKRSLTPPDAIPAAIREFYSQAAHFSQVFGVLYEVDHVVALANEGLHHQDNLQLLPADLNREKSAKEGWTPPENVFERVTVLEEEPEGS